MGKNWIFWRECAKRARQGTGSFANDWQWVFGIPIASSIGTYVISEKGMAYMTSGNPIFDAILAALVAFLITWVFAFVFRMYQTAPQLYAEQKSRAEAAEERLKPRLKLSFAMQDDGCVHRNIEIGSPEAARIYGPTLADWYRVKVEALGDSRVEKCSAKILSIKLVDKEYLQGESPKLSFALASSEQDALERTIQSPIPDYVDFLCISHDNKPSTPIRGIFSQGLAKADLFSKEGDYKIDIVVAAPEIVSEVIRLLFKWRGDQKTAEVTWLQN
jgi:hypothetical protein